MAKGRQVAVKRKEIAPFVTKTIDPTSWKPQTSWLIVLRTQLGMRDVRSFSGTYREAVVRRDEYLLNSLYASAWLIEEREKNRFAPKKAST
jgi:hypothetical protein